MYHELLRSTIDQIKHLGTALQPPCSATALNDLEKRSIAVLGHSIPHEYGEFLIQMDGLNWNGLVIYASKRQLLAGYTDFNIEGFTEGNLLYRDFEPMNDYLVFGEDGDVLYTYQISASKYRVVTTVGLTVLESFDSFEALMDDALRAHL